MKIVTISPKEVEAIYRCISFAMDHRENLEWVHEKEYWSEYDWLTKNIDTAMNAAHKLAGYETGVKQ